MKKEVKLTGRTVLCREDFVESKKNTRTKYFIKMILYCEHCDDFVEPCKDCGESFVVGEIVFCDGSNHYHTDCNWFKKNWFT
ncbi:MAG: hypothetical protein AMJ90_06865 [candidate division Zixibacteria bacterium SM23_73_2]|nr:MAG: hypothetical protein AMJ90_06865 [candidate division Zixibacteria bacterium SM23_73_2]